VPWPICSAKKTSGWPKSTSCIAVTTGCSNTTRPCSIIWSGAGRDLFNISFDVLLYDLTSTYFEGRSARLPESDKRRHGLFARSPAGLRAGRHRPPASARAGFGGDPGGVAAGLRGAAWQHRGQHHLARLPGRGSSGSTARARRIWLMDRDIPTEVVLAEMRGADPPVQYLVGTPKGRLTRLEKDLLAMALAAGPARGSGSSSCRAMANSMFSPTAPTAVAKRPAPAEGRGAGNAATTAEMVVGRASSSSQ